MTRDPVERSRLMSLREKLSSQIIELNSKIQMSGAASTGPKMIPAQPAAIQSNAKWQQFRTGIVGGAEGGVGAAASANAYAQGK